MSVVTATKIGPEMYKDRWGGYIIPGTQLDQALTSLAPEDLLIPPLTDISIYRGEGFDAVKAKLVQPGGFDDDPNIPSLIARVIPTGYANVNVVESVEHFPGPPDKIVYGVSAANFTDRISYDGSGQTIARAYTRTLTLPAAYETDLFLIDTAVPADIVSAFKARTGYPSNEVISDLLDLLGMTVANICKQYHFNFRMFQSTVEKGKTTYQVGDDPSPEGVGMRLIIVENLVPRYLLSYAHGIQSTLRLNYNVADPSSGDPSARVIAEGTNSHLLEIMA